MYYDDQGRRFNVLSGLLFGTLLGAGIALLAAPDKRGAPVRIAAPVRQLKKQVRRGRRQASVGILDAIAASVADLRARAPRRR